MRHFKYLLASLPLLLLLAGCQRDLSEINRNPNAPETADPQFLLSNVIYSFAKNNAEEGWKNGSLLAQHTSNIEFFPIDRYDVGTNTELWNASYRLLNDVRNLSEGPASNASFRAVGLVLRSAIAAQITDLWGDVPYSDAIRGATDGVFAPAYDPQSRIYTGTEGILPSLEAASTALATATDPLRGDIMYGGSLEKWRRLSNSLQVRYLLRISRREDVSARLQALVSSGLLMRGNEDNAAIPFLSSAPNQWFLINEREGRYADVRMSKTSENILVPLNDARTAVFFKPTILSQQQGAPAFRGLPNGLSRQRQNAFNFNDISLIGRLFRDEPVGVKAPIMTYAELQFCLAEAAQRGLISGSAATYYEAGIRASHAYFGATLPAGYLTSPVVALDGSADDLKKIMTQKWISNFLNGYEAWIDVRRTGLPELPIPADNLNGNRFPVRFRYPASEQAANRANYTEASQRIGGDTYDSKGWWEK